LFKISAATAPEARILMCRRYGETYPSQ